jgi:Rieske Fe-S protein
MERKQFLKISCAAICGTGVLGSLLAACSKSDTAATASTITPPAAGFSIDLNAPENAALLYVGGSVNHNNINIVHTTGGFVAFSALCTHQGCVVGYNSTAFQFQCPCHGGIFDIGGNVVSGPPPSALPSYTVTQSGSMLSVH